jgi:hypothetical protein
VCATDKNVSLQSNALECRLQLLSVLCYSSLFSILIRQPSLPGMVRPIDLAPICLSPEEVAMRPSHKILKEVDNNSTVIVDDPLRILGQ